MSHGPIMSKQVDPSTQIMLAIMLVLFVGAFFQKGFTHELLVEAAIFAVSTKLVLVPHNDECELPTRWGRLLK